MKTIVSRMCYVVIPVFMLGIYTGLTSFLACLLFILLLLFCTDRHTAGFYLLLFGGLLAGYTRATFPMIPIYGFMLDFVGLLLLSDNIQSIQKNRQGMMALGLVFLVFFFFFLYGQQTPYAISKMQNIVMHGVFMFVAYFVFDRSQKISIETLVQLLLISTIGMIVYTSARYGFAIGSIFNYDWFRSQAVEWRQDSGGESMLADYQQVGMYAAFAVSLFLAQKNFSRSKAVFYGALGVQLILTSGCRQALLAVIVLTFLRILYFNTVKLSLRKVLLVAAAFLFVSVVYVMLQRSNIETVTTALQTGDAGRNYIFLSAWNLFLNNPWFGVGLGGFPLYVDASWPHNLILEILCECGLVGFTALLIICFVFVQFSLVKIKHLTNTGVYLFLFLIALLVRCLVSGDLTVSIDLFSALFAVSITKNYLYASRKNSVR